MFIQYDITHTTTYRYRSPVTFGEHRVMFRPRDSHDLRVLATDLEVEPAADVRLIQDPHSNSIALVQPTIPSDRLRIVCRFRIEHAQSNNLELPLAPYAELYPFPYSVSERYDLEHYLRPHHDDPDGLLTQWARQFLRTDGPTGTRDLLVRMNQHIRDSLRYAAREEEGTQTPLQTLALGSGSCRDYALLMMEAARRLGIAARFVSGYLYDPALDLPPPVVPPSPAGPDDEAGTASAGAPGDPRGAEADDADARQAAAAAALDANDDADGSAGEQPTPVAPAGAPGVSMPAPTVGAGSTHAWLQIYLPGAGWLPFDPTNNLLGGNQLIRVGVARDPDQAAPIAGSWYGDKDAYLGMDVQVQVRRR